MTPRRCAVFVCAALIVAPACRLTPEARAAAAAIHVAQGQDLQEALDRAQPGQSILLDPGAVYTGPFVLPSKAGNGWITIAPAGDAFDRAVPAGTRVTPAASRLMPALVSSTGSVIAAAPGAHHYRFRGLRIAPSPGVFLYNVIDLGTDRPTAEAIPHHFAFERVYVHGDPGQGSRRGLALNSADTTVVDSHFADFKEVGFDSQAICGWNGPGPYLIENNYLEGAGENLMFGGGDPTIRDLVPADIVIRRNHFAKPLEWRRGPLATAPRWTVKNLLELKNARRVVIEGNLLERVWPDAQVGFAVLFTPRNQDGGSPWSVVEDVLFTNNIVRHAAGGINIIGWDDIHSSQQTRNLRIVNNLFYDIGGPWGFGRLFQLLNGAADVTIAHNTGAHTETPLFVGDTLPHTGFVFENNIVVHNEYGVIGSNTGTGHPSIARYLPGAAIRHNAIVGGRASDYPTLNFFPATLAGVGFAGPAKGNFRLAHTSPFTRRGTDKRDLGADLDAIVRAMGLERGPAPAASATPRGQLIALWVFWGAAALVVYTYAGYPITMFLLARLRPRPIRRQLWSPAVSIVVVACNEAKQIRRRVENLLQQIYPADRREIVVVSDGSTDETAAEALAASPDVRVIEFPMQRGKAAVFNDVLPSLRSEIVILADARQRFDPHAVEALVADFADPTVGAVSGELIVAADEVGQAGSQGTSRYWSYEKLLRRWESVVDSSVGVTGAITALRRRLFQPLPPDTILDDVLVPMRIARAGYRVMFEPLARAYDRWPAASRDELARKVRTLTGNFQLFSRERWLLNPWRNRLWLQTVSHKLLRLLLPASFLAVAFANLLLLDRPFFQLTFALQGIFYALAALGGARPDLCRRVRGLVLPYAICFLTFATVVAFVRFLRHRTTAAWEPTAVTRPA